MKEIETMPMFEELPQDNPGGKKANKEALNRLQENLIWLMNRDQVELAEIQRETRIHFPTLYAWYRGHVRVQKADIKLSDLARYFDVPLEVLLFATNEELERKYNQKKTA